MKSCPPAERLAAWLGGATGDADNQAIEEHIQACSACQNRLDAMKNTQQAAHWREQLRKQEDVSASAMRIELPPPRAPGCIGRIDRFDIEKLVGQGGMGLVYRAHDSFTNRAVAIKVLHPSHSFLPDSRRRFAKEAQATVNDPYVVTIYDVMAGAPGFRLPFIVMEFVDGESLESKLSRKGKLAARDAANIAIHVARGLAGLHRRSFVHRDIKPSNILLDRQARRARITDLGVARLPGPEGGTLTGSGGQPGTPRYMSPEQIEGREQIDGASDVFSLGVVLYEMLTGRRPFIGTGVDELKRQIAMASPLKPRAIDPDIPRELETICLVCLDKDSAYRFAHNHLLPAEALAADLERFLTHRPLECRRPGLRRRLTLFARRNRALVSLGALSVAATIIILIVSAIVVLGERGQRKQAQQVAQSKTQLANAQTKIVAEKTKLIEKEKKVSQEKATEAALQQRRARRSRYLTEIKDAYQAFAANAFAEARSLLDRQVPVDAKEPDLRGVEWYFLEHALGSNHRRVDFGGSALAGRFSPDGEALALLGISDYRTRPLQLKLWKLPAAAPERVLTVGDHQVPRHAGFTRAASGPETIDFSRDGTMIAATGRFQNENNAAAGVVKVWDCKNGEEILSVSDAGIAGEAVVFSPNGEHVLAGGYNNAVLAWSLSNGRLAWAIPGTDPQNANLPASDIPRPTTPVAVQDSVIHLLFSPSGKFLTRSVGNVSVRTQWPPARGYGLRENLSKQDTILAYNHSGLAKDPSDGRWAMAPDTAADGVRLFSPMPDNGARPRAGAYSRPGYARQAADEGFTVKIDQGEIKTVALGYSRVAMADQSGRLTVTEIDVNAGGVRQRSDLLGHEGGIHSLSFGGPGNNKLIAIGERAVTVWESAVAMPGQELFEAAHANRKRDRARRGGVRREIVTPVKEVSAAALSGDGARFAVTGDDPSHANMMRRLGNPTWLGGRKPIDSDYAAEIKLFILDSSTGQTVHTVAIPRHAPDRLQFDTAGKTLLAGTPDNRARLIDVDTGKVMRVLGSADRPVLYPLFTPDCRHIFSANNRTKTLDRWDVGSGLVVASFATGKETPSFWAVHGNLLAVPVNLRHITLWDMETGNIVHDMKETARNIERLAFIDGGKRLLSQTDSILTLWSVEDAAEICTIASPFTADDFASEVDALEGLSVPAHPAP